MIKLFVSDIDGTLTDGCCGYTAHGELYKCFSHRDGRGFHLLKEKTKVKTMWITSETGGINKARADKLIKLGTLDYFADGSWDEAKVQKVDKVCKELGIGFNDIAFIGDDTNDSQLLKAVGFRGCPNDAHEEVKRIRYMNIMNECGGYGAVREFIDLIIWEKLCELK